MPEANLGALSGGEVCLRLLVAFLLGALLGLERETRERPAGLRTHILVCVATCLSMMVALLMGGDGSAPGRVAQGVLTGVGFLGAGTIIHQGNLVRGLTTAASIWAAAAVGLAVGLGWHLGAVLASVLVLVALSALHSVESRVHGVGRHLQIRATLHAGTDFPAELTAILERSGVSLLSVDLRPPEAGVAGELSLVLDTTGPLRPGALLGLVRSVPGIAEAAAQPSGRADRRRRR